MSAALRRLAPLATTGVGSLPFRRAREAVEHVLAAYELPFCPQLPQLDGDMVTEWLGADPGRCGWSPDRDRQLPAAWDAFAPALSAGPPEHRVVKLQVTGPVTLAVALEPSAGRTGQGDAVVELAGQIALWLSASASELTQWCDDELGLDVVLVADEPGLDRAALSAEHAHVWDPLRRAASAWGLHVCCAVPWTVVAAARPDVLSFDLVRCTVGAAAVPALSGIVKRGGRIVWGALDGGERPDPRRARARIERAWAALDGFGADELAAASLLSATCGTGGYPVAIERGVAWALAHVAAAVRREPVPARRPVAISPTCRDVSRSAAATGARQDDS